MRSIPAFASMDGWRLFRIAHEDQDSLRVVGLIYALPTGEHPVEIQVLRERGLIKYQLRQGLDDPHWGSLSDSKRWNAVYLYAAGEHEEQWIWSEAIQGSLGDV